MQRAALVLFPLCLTFTIGCSASVAGQIDEESVPTLYSALFTEDEFEIGDAKFMTVSGAGLSVLDGCNGMTKRQQNANDLQDELNKALEDETDADKIKDAMDAFATGIVDYETKNIPTDLWVVNLGASAADEDDIDGGEAKIDFLDPDNDPDVSGALIVCRVNDHPSVSEDDNDLPFVKRDQNCYGALEADIEFVKWVAGETFEAKATATVFDIEDFDPLNDDEPKDVGEVEIAINAGFCQPLQDALDDAKEIAKDAQGG